MKRFAIVLLLFAMVITMIGCANTSEGEPAQTSTPPSTSTAESKECVKHDFCDATLVRPRYCQSCKATDGEPLYVQCETWEDVVGNLHFGEYPYDLRVVPNKNGDGYMLFLTFDDTEKFTTEESLKEFIVCVIGSLTELSGFVRGNYLGMVIDTPAGFSGDTAVSITIPGGTIVATLIGSNMFGFYTVLVKDEKSPNVDILGNIYNESFVGIGVALD